MTDTALAKTEKNTIDVYGCDFEQAQRICQPLAKSQMVPKDYQGNVANCMIALDLSHRLGMSVMAVMQKLYVVHGKPAFEAQFVAAAANACGKYSPLRCKENGLQGDDFGVYAIAKDLATGEELKGTTITQRMVKDEGWGDKAGSKWKTMPEQMYKYRAMTFWQREFDPGLTMGIRTADEIEDIETKAEVVRSEPKTLKDVTAVIKRRTTETPVEATADVQQLEIDCIEIAREIWDNDAIKHVNMICSGEDKYFEYSSTFVKFSFDSASATQLKWLRNRLAEMQG